MDEWRAFNEHLEQALALEGSDRASWLTQLAARSPELAQAIAETLRQSGRTGFSSFLAEPLLPEPVAAEAEASLVGRNVGPYVIEAEIGRGGMGSVWRARRTDGLYEGLVAIKFVHASWIGHREEERFRSEGRLLGQLHHANIARLIDAGILDGTHPYLVLEYVDGEPIDVYCSRHLLDVESRVKLFLNVLAAVAHAHSHLIVHRDIKPGNVLVARDGTVKLLDFGIAKLIDDDTGAVPATRSGMTALTPQYAAPEQLLGKPVTTQTDVYASGLVLYVLLTGSYPFGSKARSNAELVQAVLTQDAARASASVAGTTIRARELQGDLDNILGKALKKSPDERYPSAGAFAEDLRRFLAHEPVQARPDTISYHLSKFVRRHRGGVVVGALLAVALLATSSIAVFQLFQTRAQRDLARAEAKRANAEADLAQYLGGDSLGKATQDAVRQRLDRARQFVGARFRADPALAARLLIDISSQYLDIGDESTAAAVIVEAEATGRRLGDDELLGLLACLRTEDLAIAHDLSAARVQLASGISNMQRLRYVSPGLRAECASAAAFVQQEDGLFAQAATELRGAVQYLDESGMHGSSRYTSLANDLARAFLMTGDYRGAWSVESGVLALMNDNGRANTPAYFAYAAVACTALRAGGQPRHSLQFSTAIQADAHEDSRSIPLPYYFTACVDSSRLALDPQAAQEAETSLLRAADEAQAAGMTMVLVGYQSTAVSAAIDRGDLAVADARWAPLAAIEFNMLAAHERGVDIVRLLLVHARLGLAHGRLAEASALVDQAEALIAARKQPTNRDARDLELLRTQVLLARDANQEAVRHARLAEQFARTEAVDPRSSAWIGEALVWRAQAEAALGSSAAAATARQALPHLLDNLDAQHPLIAAARRLAGPESP